MGLPFKGLTNTQGGSPVKPPLVKRFGDGFEQGEYDPNQRVVYIRPGNPPLDVIPDNNPSENGKLPPLVTPRNPYKVK